jgi:hypothetical protein
VAIVGAFCGAISRQQRCGADRGAVGRASWSLVVAIERGGSGVVFVLGRSEGEGRFNQIGKFWTRAEVPVGVAGSTGNTRIFQIWIWIEEHHEHGAKNGA